MTKSQFKGYILEEMLAYLIRTSGYTLITKAPPNDPDLSNKTNGLNLRGRGANHQIDVLGELDWIPAFSFPLRLMIEAKFRNDKTGINVIRDQVGILADVNQNYFVIKDKEPKPRYRYVSAVFSASGFTGLAIDMAIAHQIQLVDLSDNEFRNLKRYIESFSNNIFNNSAKVDNSLLIRIRKYLREHFQSGNLHNSSYELNEIQQQYCNNLVESVKENYRELFLGMSSGGFILLLKAEEPQSFIEYARNRPTHDIKIKWNKVDNGEKWIITPAEPYSDKYKLTFKLPPKLHNWIFELSRDKFQEAINQKRKNFYKISIYYIDKEGRSYVFNLNYKNNI